MPALINPTVLAKRSRVSVIGSGVPVADLPADVENLAESLGRMIASLGLVLVCGGKAGVMEAACRGALAEGGLTLGILPSNDRTEANPYVALPVVTGLGQMRNHVVVANGDAVIAVHGGAGTLSEIGLALKLGRRVAAFGTHAGLPDVRALEDLEQARGFLQETIGVAG